MTLNIFFFFPETDLQVLNDNSKKIVNDFFLISKHFKGDKNIKIHYDENNVKSFIYRNSITGIYLDNDINRLRIKFKEVNAFNINTYKLIDNSFYYLQWNLTKCSVDYCSEILKEITERKIRFPKEIYLLINFNNSIESCRSKIFTFKDAIKSISFPKDFIHIDFVSDFYELDIWLRTYHVNTFTLLDKTRFTRTSEVQQGKPVFIEIETNRYWYLDNLHKDEYEVFNSQREHIGVANLSGQVDYEKKVNGRIF